MAHIHSNRNKLLARVRRIGGQVSALEKALEADADCTAVLTQVAAVRGAVHGLMMEVLNDHLQAHVVEEADEPRRAEEAALVADLMRRYLK
ncbi:metal/formaldehyde-sensitive transcriptional repressor [Pseudoxanthomonas sp. PXM02]|jgi:DNA-binding FrmR family transcriptional regulator|uniref:metal/formaldehyde-sensitive transcriptional repressor n=1 Tax=Pseudoxanthomonas sp. PXM02 TaxID=2769294 RepID=UPI0017826E17|nr:metal/formaldehyde-sensitive transcriptional repressor [Pseudoxanthomonas sp. PXM02]MBD9481096.1 metal/formaldehyde-sensitive transcriptional repressor [Pseudoxanthomonas sp. PXM02]